MLLPKGQPAAGALGYLYADEDCITPAEVYYDVSGTKGPLIPLDTHGRRSVTLDGWGRQPNYWGPEDGATRLWIRVNGVVNPVDADYKWQLDGLRDIDAGYDSRISGLTETVDGQAGQLAEHAGQITDLDTSKVDMSDRRLQATGYLVSQFGTPNGSNDRTLLQTAISAAAEAGGWAIIDAHLTISGSVTVPSGARIDGSRGRVTQTANLSNTFVVANASDVVLRNVRATGLGTDYVPSSAVFAASAVNITGASRNVLIDGCDFRSFAGVGVNIGGTAADVRVVNSRLQGPGPGIIQPVDHNYGMGVVGHQNSSAWAVIGCDISHYAQGVNSGDCTDVRIIGNYLHDMTGQHGIYLDATINLVIADNIIRDTGLQGIKVQLANTTNGIDIDHVTITGNVITASGSHGILLTKAISGGRQVRRVTVTGNSISTAGAGGDGINLIGVHGAVVSSNVIHNARHGLSATDCVGLTIGLNRLSSLQQNGVLLTATSDVDVVGNRITDPAVDDILAGEFGIFVTGACSNVKIDGNTVSDANGRMRYGLYLNTPNQGTVVVRNNDLTGATDHGARLDNAQDVKEWSNNVLGGTTGPVLNFPTTRTIKGPPLEYTATAPPSSGTWPRGAVVWNTTPSLGGPVGWVCTTAGTPGVWSQFGARQSVWNGPAGNALAGASIDPMWANISVGATTAGVLHLARVLLERGGPINSVEFVVTAAGTGLVADQCWIGVYSAAGDLLGQTADQSVALASGGQKSSALTVPIASQPFGTSVYVALLWNGSVAPQLRGAAATATFANVGLTAPNFRWANAGSELTALPATLPTMTASTQPSYLALK
ncbi:hypothetical protein C1I95_14710 [Micromonospora craterilacus]|uniref:Right handed beta helix domain-containing protein n=1 Tax=Micromonospora craterilacus TaxID=1655439 RepID=A0A2W2EZ49_9ACTN|nr:hypothetical protein C1I95_14710 [Micromonospora craterilacus]